jgi:hypothetical protein
MTAYAPGAYGASQLGVFVVIALASRLGRARVALR